MSMTETKERPEFSTMRKMQAEIEAARVLREQIATICADDPEFLRDAIEGETSVRELIAKLVAEEGEDKAILEGLDVFTQSLAARKDRIKTRVDTRRALLGSALEIAELTKLETPTGTVALSKVAPKPIIQDEAEIPSKFWKPAAPTLDRKALNAAMKDGEEVPGVTLSNGSVTVTIRRS